MYSTVYIASVLPLDFSVDSSPVPKLHIQCIPIRNRSVNVKKSLFDASSRRDDLAAQGNINHETTGHAEGSSQISSHVPKLYVQRIPIRNRSTNVNKVSSHDASSQHDETEAQDMIQKSAGHREETSEMSSSSSSSETESEEEVSKMSVGGEQRVSETVSEEDDEFISKKSVAGSQRVSPRGKKNEGRKVMDSDEMDNSESSDHDISSDHDDPSDNDVSLRSEYTRKLRSRNYKHTSASSQEDEGLCWNTAIKYQLRSRKQQRPEHLRGKELPGSESSEESSSEQEFEPSEYSKRPTTSDEDSTEDGTGVGDELKSESIVKENGKAKHKQSSCVHHTVGRSLLKTKRHFKLNVEKIMPNLVFTESSDQQLSDDNMLSLRSRRDTQKSKQQVSNHKQSEHELKSRKMSSSSQKKTTYQSVFSSDEDGSDQLDLVLRKHDGSPSILARHSPRSRRQQTKGGASNKGLLHSEPNRESTSQESELERKKEPTVSLKHRLYQSTKDDTGSTTEIQVDKRRKSPRKRKAVSTDTSDQSTHDENERSVMLNPSDIPVVTPKQHHKSPKHTKSPKSLRPSKKRQRRSQVELLVNEAYSGSHIQKVQLDFAKALISRLLREDLSTLSSMTHDTQTGDDRQSARQRNDQNSSDTVGATSQHASASTWPEFSLKIVRSQTESDSMNEGVASDSNQPRKNKRRSHHHENVSESVALKRSAERTSSDPEQRITKRVRFLSDSEESDHGVLSETDQQLMGASEHEPILHDIHLDATDSVIEVAVTTSSPYRSPRKNNNTMSIHNKGNNSHSSCERDDGPAISENDDRGPTVIGELPLTPLNNGVSVSTPPKHPVTSTVDNINETQDSDSNTETASERPGTPNSELLHPSQELTHTHKDNQSVSDGPSVSAEPEIAVATEVTVCTIEANKGNKCVNHPSTYTNDEPVSSQLSEAEPAPEFDLSKSLSEVNNETECPKAVVPEHLTQETNDSGAHSSSLSVVLNDVLSSNFTDSELDVKQRKTGGRKRGRIKRNSKPKKITNTRVSKHQPSRRKATIPKKRNTTAPKKDSGPSKVVNHTSTPSVKSPASSSQNPTNSSSNDKSPLGSPEVPLLNDEYSQPSQPPYVVVAHSDDDIEHSMSQSQFNAAPIARFERLNRESSQGSETTVVSGSTSATDSPCKRVTPQLYNLRRLLLKKC